MYGFPGSLIQFGVKRAKQKPGRKSAQVQFLEQQRDLVPVDLYTSKLSGKAPARSIGQGDEVGLGAVGAGPASSRAGKKLYVPVTRKVSPEIGTRTGKVSLTGETKLGKLAA
jgi:hypothetical protein